MIRRFGAPRRAAQHYRLRHGAYAVILRKGQVLLTFQTAPRAEWQLPGGGIDAGESALQALRRETLEETGWRIAPLRRLGAFRRFTFMPEYDLWAEKLCHIYLARPLRAVAPPSEPGHTAAWVEGARALRMMDNDGDRAFLMAALREIG